MNKKLGLLVAMTVLSLQMKSMIRAEEGPLALHLYPQNQQVKVGESVAWYLTAAGSEPLEYQWKLDGKNLSGQQSNTLKIASAKTSDQGIYSCSVKNKFGAVDTDPVQLSLSPAPSIATSQKINVLKAPENAAAKTIVKPEK